MPGRGFRQSLEIKEPRATVQEDWQMRVTIIFELAVLTLCFAVRVFAAGPIEISPKALVGCRSPEVPGCATCCAKNGNSNEEMSWASAGSKGDVTPWYNSSSILSKPEPGCPQCASCSRRNEEELLNLLAIDRDCDCGTIKARIDPCFSPESCECYCFRLKELKKKCPYSVRQISKHK